MHSAQLLPREALCSYCEIKTDILLKDEDIAPLRSDGNSRVFVPGTRPGSKRRVVLRRDPADKAHRSEYIPPHQLLGMLSCLPISHRDTVSAYWLYIAALLKLFKAHNGICVQ
jgi:hypothetical protein